MDVIIFQIFPTIEIAPAKYHLLMIPSNNRLQSNLMMSASPTDKEKTSSPGRNLQAFQGWVKLSFYLLADFPLKHMT